MLYTIYADTFPLKILVFKASFFFSKWLKYYLSLFSCFNSPVCNKKVEFYDCLIHVSVYTCVLHLEETNSVFVWTYEVLFWVPFCCTSCWWMSESVKSHVNNWQFNYSEPGYVKMYDYHPFWCQCHFLDI